MARIKNNIWNRYKYKINGGIILLSCYFLYQSLYPTFPDTLPPQTIGEFEVMPIPYNDQPPYFHHGGYVKDFILIFNQGDMDNIRQAYLNIGEKALPIEKLQVHGDGILHGSKHGQEVHAVSSEVLTGNDKIWLTIETWQGQQQITNWSIPKALLP